MTTHTQRTDPSSTDLPTAGGPADTVVVDVDGTLVDSNYQHVIAWARAFRREGIVVPLWRIHRHVGMGGDRLVAAVAGDQVEQRFGDVLRERWAGEFSTMLAEISTLPFSRELLETLRDRGVRVVLASSGRPDHLDRYLDLLGARQVVAAWVSAADVTATKPAPDLVSVALARVAARPETSIMIGDSPWDLIAARNAGVPGHGVLTGGFCVHELVQAGAGEVFGDLDELSRALDDLLRVPHETGAPGAEARNLAVDAMPDDLRAGSDYSDETQAVLDTSGEVREVDEQE